jgi:hypothetical protein
VWRRDPRGRGYGKISKNLWDSNQFEGLGFPRHELGAMHRKKEVSASWPDAVQAVELREAVEEMRVLV